MELKIIETKKNDLLSREELKIEILFDAVTPSNKGLQDAISSKKGASSDLIVVKHIYTAFGSKKADVTAYIYDSQEAKDSTETKSKKQRAAEKKAVEEAKKKTVEGEVPKEEAKPAEKKPEEKKEEEKKEAPKKEEPKVEKKEEKAPEKKEEVNRIKDSKYPSGIKKEKKEKPKEEKKEEAPKKE